MTDRDLLELADEIGRAARRLTETVAAQREQITRLEAMLKGQQEANRQLLTTNVRLGIELKAAEEHADSLI